MIERFSGTIGTRSWPQGICKLPKLVLWAWPSANGTAGDSEDMWGYYLIHLHYVLARPGTCHQITSLTFRFRTCKWTPLNHVEAVGGIPQEIDKKLCCQMNPHHHHILSLWHGHGMDTLLNYICTYEAMWIVLSLYSLSWTDRRSKRHSQIDATVIRTLALSIQLPFP